MHVSRFTTGGFVLHKVTLPGRKGHYSAWFAADGTILDAENINMRRAFSSGRVRSVSRKGPSWAELQTIGRRIATSAA